MPKYALSVKQPWAWLIVSGFKDIENRTWGTSNPLFSINLPQRIYVHTGKSDDPDEHIAAWDILSDSEVINQYEREKVTGGIIGEVDIVGVIDRDSPCKSPWGIPVRPDYLRHKTKARAGNGAEPIRCTEEE